MNRGTSLQLLEPDLRRVRADNQSALTDTGTYTYLLGRGEVIVIDPGPDFPSHLEAIRAALAPDEAICAILVTHCHLDHSALAGRLSALTGAPTYAFGPAHSGRSQVMQALAAAGMPSGAEGFDLQFTPDHRLTHGQTLTLGGVQIEALHTPGHTGCHLSFAHQGRLFSGDHVMGWSTSLISPPDGDMTAYLNSLALLQNRAWTAAYPGHGAPILQPAQRLEALMTLRLARQAALTARLGPRPAIIPELARAIYTDLSPQLLPAAERNLLAHLIKLWQDGKVTADPSPTPTARYTRKL